MALSAEELKLHGRCGLHDLQAPRTAGERCRHGSGGVAKSNARKVALRYPSLGVVVGRILAQVVILVWWLFCGMSIALRGATGWWGTSFLRCSCSGPLCATRRCTGCVERPSARERARRCDQPTERAAARKNTTSRRRWKNMGRFLMLLVIKLLARSWSHVCQSESGGVPPCA